MSLPEFPAPKTPEIATRVIKPRGRFELVDWREIWEYRDLFYFMVRRDVRTRYAQTVLGFGWAILQPLTTMILFSLVFSGLADMPSDGAAYPLFSIVAVVPWTYFSSTVSAASGSLVSNSMISKVYFPRMVVPMTTVLAGLVDFAIAMSIVAVMMVFYTTAPTIWVLALPILLLIMMATAAGLGLWLSALAVQYRDLKYALSFAVSLMMYAAPVIWPLSQMPEKYRLFYGIYPMAGVISGFRSALIGTTPMPWDVIAVGAVSAAVLFVTGAMYFRRREHLFADIF